MTGSVIVALAESLSNFPSRIFRLVHDTIELAVAYRFLALRPDQVINVDTFEVYEPRDVRLRRPQRPSAHEKPGQHRSQ